MKNKTTFFKLIGLAFYITTLFFPLAYVVEDQLFFISVNNFITGLPLFIGGLLAILAIFLSCFKKEILKISSLVIGFSSIFLLSCSGEMIHNIFGYSRSEIILSNSLIIGIICIAILVLFEIREIMSSNTFLVKDIVEIGIFVSIALILDLPIFKIHIGQNGGSISLVMLPLILLSTRKSFIKSFIACGLIFGLLNCLIDPYGFICFPFDYFLAYGSIAFISLFRKKISSNTVKGFIYLIASLLIVFVLRTAWHTISGLIFYQPITFVESLVYQLLYLVPSFGGIAIILIFLYKPLCYFSKKR